MNTSLKPVLLTALIALPLLGVAEAQSRRELRQDRREYRQAVRRGDWAAANQKAREIQQDRYRLQRRNWNSGNYYNNRWNNNAWNNNNNYYYRTNPYNNGYYYNNYRRW
ncbi:MAG: hypothetical protein KF760_18955 [Candidatus Eremiobacteraeota bacterium]|nr:hypothetical protein [Candidatus Eremiobacteraeota bacterium]MCW5868479.1 hypothetical protein [Candidatus Eremiobacteraeota bacterium]